MEHTTWFKVKNGKTNEIEKPTCNQMQQLLNKGYTVNAVIENGMKIKVNTYSPLGYWDYLHKEHNYQY